MAIDTSTFYRELHSILNQAEKLGFVAVEVNSGNLHRRVGDYPGQNHRMPVCCDVMYDEMKYGNEVIKQPKSGKSASVVIKYRLPR